ncbi:MAG: hypothetical protein M1821_007347 [Bathelium mastoideum]|nr:MAG: hypothetical protein M1821_007347 [Bathelium mastoideum]
MQQGCLYKHEFPTTAAKWASVGFATVPGWIKGRSSAPAKRLSEDWRKGSSYQSSRHRSQRGQAHYDQTKKRPSQGSSVSNGRGIPEGSPSLSHAVKRGSSKPDNAMHNMKITSSVNAPASLSGSEIAEHDLLIDFNPIHSINLPASLSPSNQSLEDETMSPLQRPAKSTTSINASAAPILSQGYCGGRESTCQPSQSPSRSFSESPLSSYDSPTPRYSIPNNTPSVEPPNFQGPQDCRPRHRGLFSALPAQPITFPSTGSQPPPRIFDKVIQSQGPAFSAIEMRHTEEPQFRESVQSREHLAEVLVEGLEGSRHAPAAGKQRRMRRGVGRKGRRTSKGEGVRG